MKTILKKVHVYLYVASVAFIYFLLWPFFYYCSRSPARYKTMNRLRRAWGFFSSAFVGFFFRYEYEQPIDWSKTYIICPNHTSNLDIAAMSVLVNGDVCFMGKEELKEGLVTGLFFRSVDIPVNRKSKISSYRAFKNAAERLQNGTSIIMFPEGKIGDNYPPTMHEFKNGPFKLAIELKIPIIPVSSSNTWKMLWDDGTKYGTRPGICEYYVHKPIETSSLTSADADALRDEVYATICQKVAAGNIKSETLQPCYKST
jgi:1-acyl-sn-glycerol-3-phosphate acyltransferase